MCLQHQQNLSQMEQAASELGVKAHEFVHIGDREQKDITGPHKIGAKAIYTTAIVNRGLNTNADNICTDYSQLPSIIDHLNQ